MRVKQIEGELEVELEDFNDYEVLFASLDQARRSERKRRVRREIRVLGMKAVKLAASTDSYSVPALLIDGPDAVLTLRAMDSYAAAVLRRDGVNRAECILAASALAVLDTISADLQVGLHITEASALNR